MGALFWNALVDGEGPLQGRYEALNMTFNPSELNAYRSGNVLRDLLSDLNSNRPYRGNINVLAHSQGNIIVGEALRLWSEEHATPLIKNYFALNAAISAGAYGSDDIDVSPRLILEIAGHVDYFRSWPIGRTPRLYDDVPLYDGSKSASQKWINFFLRTDTALHMWRTNNLAKLALPVLIGATGGPNWPFYYRRTQELDVMHSRHAIRLGGEGIYIESLIDFPDGFDPFVFMVHRVANQDHDKTHRRDLVFRQDSDIGPDLPEVLAMSAVSTAEALGLAPIWGTGNNRDWISQNAETLGLYESPGSEGFANHGFQFHYSLHRNWSYWKAIVRQMINE